MKYFTYVTKGAKESSSITVWGLETYDNNLDYLFIAEGIFDAVKIHNLDQPAIAVLANTGNPDLKNWLKVLPQKIIAICDQDEAGKKLASLANKAYYTPKPHKDLGEMSQEEVGRFIQGILRKEGLTS